MQSNTPLFFNLVKSLSKAEKKYFSQFAKIQVKGETNDYLKLFEAIRRTEIFPEKKISGLFTTQKQLANAQGYLVKQVLRCLREIRQDKTPDARAYAEVRELEILHELGLSRYAQQLLPALKKRLHREEKYSALTRLLRVEATIINWMPAAENKEAILDKCLNEELFCLDQMRVFARYRILLQKLFSLIEKKGFPRNEGDREDYLLFLEDPLLKPDAPIKDSSSLYYHHYIRSLVHNHLYDYHSSYLTLTELIENSEKHKEWIKENPRFYWNILRSLIDRCILLKKYDEGMRHIKTAARPETSGSMRNADLLLMLELIIYMETGQLRKGISLISPLEHVLHNERLGTLKVFTHIIRLNLAILHFLSGKHKQARSLLNELLQRESLLTEDLKIFVRILDLMLHFEIGDQDLLEHKVRSVYRFLYKRKHIYRLEHVILNFIRTKSPEMISQKAQKLAFMDLKKELQSLLQDPFEQKALRDTFILPWVESKISGRSVEEVLRSEK